MTAAASAVMIASTSLGVFSTGATTGTTAAAPTQATRPARDAVAPAAPTGRSTASGQQQALPSPGQARPRGSLLDISA